MEDLLEYILKKAKPLPEHDCMGKPMKTFDDLGGRCTLGEYAHKDNYFTCEECGENFCRKHVRFVNKTPLCSYGPSGSNGCYSKHSKYTTGHSSQTYPTSKQHTTYTCTGKDGR